MNNLILRIGTSVFILPIFILCIYFSGIFLKLLLLIIFFISIYEINKNFQKNFIYFFLIFLQLIFCLSFYSLRGSTSISFIYLIWLISIVILTDIVVLSSIWGQSIDEAFIPLVLTMGVTVIGGYFTVREIGKSKGTY